MAIKYINRIFWPILLICLSALVSVTWFKTSSFFSGTDVYFPHNRTFSAYASLFAWDGSSTGNARSSAALTIPYGAFLYVTELLNLPATIAQKMWFYYMFAGSGLAMFLLVSIIIKTQEAKISYIPGLIAGLLYMYNPFVGAMATGYTYLWLTYAFLPLKVGLYIKALVEHRSYRFITFIIVIWILTSGSAYTNPKYLILDLLPLVLFSLYHFCCICKEKTERIVTIKFSIAFGIMLILSSAYWLVPTLAFISEAFSDTEKAYNIIGLSRLTGYNLNASGSVTSAIRLLGFWALNGNFDGIKYYSWAAMYSNPIVVVSQFLILGTSYITFYVRRQKPILYYFLILNGLSILGMMGMNKPGGWLNGTLIKSIPHFLDVFSYPYVICGIYFVLSISLLFAHGVNTALKHKGTLLKGALVSMFIVLISVTSKPVWTGEIFTPRATSTYATIPSNLYEIPNYYYKASEYLQTQLLDSKIFSVPYSRTGGATYLWENGGYAGIDVTSQLLGNTIYGTNPVSMSINKNLINGEVDKAVELLPFLNTRYLLIHTDVHPVLYDKTTSYSINTGNKLREILNVTGTKQVYGKLEVYKLPNNAFLPHVYIQKDLADNSRLNLMPNQTARTLVEFKKISPVKYRVIIHKVKGTSSLVLSETFHPGWKAYITNAAVNKTDLLSSGNLLEKYKIFDGDLQNQSTKEELTDFIRNGWITTLGNGNNKNYKHFIWENGTKKLSYKEYYVVDFISKNFQNSIQNNNLPNGHFWEGWIGHVVQIPDTYHTLVNNYANQWLIDSEKLCNKPSSYCTKNSDGSYDISMLVEFNPQKLVVAGIGISILTLVLLIFGSRFRRVIP